MRSGFRLGEVGFLLFFAPTPPILGGSSPERFLRGGFDFGKQITLIVWLSRRLKPPFLGVWGQYGDAKRKNMRCTVRWNRSVFRLGGVGFLSFFAPNPQFLGAPARRGF
jgi:hypothetical protein